MRQRCTRFTLLALALVILACCSPLPAQIDGFRLGPEFSCDDAACEDAEAVALRAFHSAQPVRDIRMFGEAHPENRSGTLYIAVFVLADGSDQAIGVHCGVGGCHPLRPVP